MRAIKRKYLLILGLTILIVSLALATVPRYRETRDLKKAIEDKLPILEESYDRYIKQLKAMEDLKKVLKKPPDLNIDIFKGMKIVKNRGTISISGRVNGRKLIKILDYFTKNPNSYIESLKVNNKLENPMTISTPVESYANIVIEVRILELRE